MSDIFGGIFNSFRGLADDIGGAFGVSGKTLTSALGAAGKAATSDKEVNQSQLERGLLELGVNKSFSQTKTNPTESVNMETLEAAWHSRLNRWAQIRNQTEIKLK